MYQLMIKKGRSYEPINIRCHSKFIIIDNRKIKDYLATLNEIDLLTTQYSEKEFRVSLVQERLISTEDFDKQIEIRYKRKDKLETLADSIIFSEGKAYLEEKTLENTLIILSSRADFIRTLIYKYIPKEDGRYNTREYVNLGILKYLEGVLNNSYDSAGLKNLLLPYQNIIDDKNIFNNLHNYKKEDIIKVLIKIFYYNEIYERKLNLAPFRPEIGDYGDHVIFNKEKIQYRRLHDLAKFVFYYDKKRRELEESEHEYQEEFLEPGELTFKKDDSHINSTVKKRKKVRKPLEGQISFFN